MLSKAYRGKQISATGNQNDLAATLLHQFHADATKFNWSNDLLNPGRINFAYTDFDESLGWINDKGSFIYNSTTRKTDKIVGNIPDSFALTQAVAYRQRLYKEFLEMGNK